MSHRKGYEKGYICQLSEHYEDMLCTAATQSGPFRQRAGGRGLLGGRAARGGGWAGPGSARRSAASEVSVPRPQPASSDAGSQGRRSRLPRPGSSLRPSHLQNFGSRTALNRKQRICMRHEESSGTDTETHRTRLSSTPPFPGTFPQLSLSSAPGGSPAPAPEQRRQLSWSPRPTLLGGTRCWPRPHGFGHEARSHGEAQAPAAPALPGWAARRWPLQVAPLQL